MPSGGTRQGAGRPKGKGRYGEATTPLRVPISMKNDVIDFVSSYSHKIPFYSDKVQAGLPTLANDHMEEKISIGELLIQNPNKTFMVRAQGDSMINAGISDGDILVVDKSIKATHGKIVIAALNDEFTVKRLYKKDGIIRLMPENDRYAPIDGTPETELRILGVVTSVIRIM